MYKNVITIVCFSVCLPASAETIYVRYDAPGAANGASWSDAHTSLIEAVHRAESGDEVWVAAGTYAGTVVMKNGVRIYGGFAGDETAASASDPVDNPTYISGGGERRCVASNGNDSSAVLRGFVITDGFVDLKKYGGGMELMNSRATIVECVFTGNRAESLGGAVVNWDGAPTFVNCRFHGNKGGYGGGAVVNRYDTAPEFVNCLFDDNEARDGGAVLNVTGESRFTNCTFATNRATRGMGGAFYDDPGKSVLRNCIVWGNAAVRGDNHGIHNRASLGGLTDVAHSDVQGGWPGQGNINADPQFTHAAARDFRPRSASPCAGRGQRAVLPPDTADLDWDGDTSEPLPIDLGRNPHGTGPNVDMGAFRRGRP